MEGTTADDMMAGPGLFSGDPDGFTIIGDKKKKANVVATPASSTPSVANMDMNQTSKDLEVKIRQLQRDQMELELLKREVDKKLKN
jgi:hypothetical protein